MQARASRTSSRKSENELAARGRRYQLSAASRFFQHADLLRGHPEVEEMKSSDVLRFERYLKFHLTEIREQMRSEREGDAEYTWSAKWGSSVDIVRVYLSRSLEDINSALSRMRDGTYGDCVGCGNEINVRRLEVVPWAKLCLECQEKSDAQWQRRDSGL